MDTRPLIAWLALVAGCGSEDPAPPARFGPLRVVTGAPSMPAEAPAATTFPAEGEIRGMAAAGGLLVVGTDANAFFLDEATGLEALEVWSDDPEAPLEAGPVELVFRREGTLLVLAEAGLFHTDGPRLLPSPDSDAWQALGIHGVSEGPSSELWLAADGGLARLTADELTWLHIQGESGPPSAMQVTEERVLVAYEERLYEVHLESQLVEAVPYPTGTIHAMAPGADHAVYIATSEGLFERDGAGVYSQYTLSAGVPAAVTSLAYYPKDGTFALSDAGVVVARPGEPLAGVMSRADVAGPSIVADGAGNLWSGASASVDRLPVGTPIGFAEDVAPIFETLCAPCHAAGQEGAPQHDLGDSAIVAALGPSIQSRIALGQMPPAGAPELTGSQLDILNLWFLTGQQP